MKYGIVAALLRYRCLRPSEFHELCYKNLTQLDPQAVKVLFDAAIQLHPHITSNGVYI